MTRDERLGRDALRARVRDSTVPSEAATAAPPVISRSVTNPIASSSRRIWFLVPFCVVGVVLYRDVVLS